MNEELKPNEILAREICDVCGHTPHKGHWLSHLDEATRYITALELLGYRITRTPDAASQDVREASINDFHPDDIGRAQKILGELCDGNHRWRMSIPAQRDDSDMVLSRVIRQAASAETQRPCPHVYTSNGGTSHCTLAESDSRELARLREENQHLKDLNAMLKDENTAYRQRPASQPGELARLREVVVKMAEALQSAESSLSWNDQQTDYIEEALALAQQYIDAVGE